MGADPELWLLTGLDERLSQCPRLAIDTAGRDLPARCSI
jgi:hypothetical protein